MLFWSGRWGFYIVEESLPVRGGVTEHTLRKCRIYITGGGCWSSSLSSLIFSALKLPSLFRSRLEVKIKRRNTFISSPRRLAIRMSSASGSFFTSVSLRRSSVATWSGCHSWLVAPAVVRRKGAARGFEMAFLSFIGGGYTLRTTIRYLRGIALRRLMRGGCFKLAKQRKRIHHTCNFLPSLYL